MKSRDGFEVVNELMRDEMNRRDVLKALGWSAAGVLGSSLALPSFAHAQKPKGANEVVLNVRKSLRSHARPPHASST